MRRNLFWKLALTFFALLVSVLLSVDFFAERAIRKNYESSAFAELSLLARFAQTHPPIAGMAGSKNNQLATLQQWASDMGTNGVRFTIITIDGRTLADSQIDPGSMDMEADRPEVHQAAESGQGRSIRRGGPEQREMLYYAVREDLPGFAPVILRFAVPAARVDQSRGSFRRTLWLTSLLILFFAGVASLLISLGFSDRVERLKEFSRRIAGGDFRPLPSDPRGDALGELGASLNQTAARMDRVIRTLTEERDLSAAILGSMVEGVAVVNAGERLMFANQGFAEILDLDLPPKPGSALVEVVRQTELIEAARRVLAGEARVESEITTGTLKQRFFATTVARVRDEETSGAVIVLHDITELRKLERVRRDFVANVSHEFRSPLTAIQGFAETLLEGAARDPAARKRFLGIIVEHSRRLGRLTEDLLRLSAMDADRLDMEIQRVTVSRLIETCVETARHRASEKDISLSVNSGDGLPDIAGDRNRLAEVLQNLLDNAIQYTSSGGQVMLGAAVSGKDVVFTVADTGIGIPLADQPRIFERFYRVDAARSREAGGTGLGLSIAKHIVERHGGRLWVDSEVGRGSKFHFSVPIFDSELISSVDHAAPGIVKLGSAPGSSNQM